VNPTHLILGFKNFFGGRKVEVGRGGGGGGGRKGGSERYAIYNVSEMNPPHLSSGFITFFGGKKYSIY